jgi:hypothetical protein
MIFPLKPPFRADFPLPRLITWGGETRESSFSSGYRSNYSLLWLNMNLFSFNTSTSRVASDTQGVAWISTWPRSVKKVNHQPSHSGLGCQSKSKFPGPADGMVNISIPPLGICDAAAGRCTLPPNTSDALAWTGCATKSKRKRSESVHTSEEKENIQRSKWPLENVTIPCLFHIECLLDHKMRGISFTEQV